MAQLNDGTAFGLCVKTVVMLEMSTVLFLHNAPIGYTMSPEKNGFVLRPHQNHEYVVIPPILVVTKRMDEWEVEGTNDLSLIAQVRDEVERYLKVDATTTLLSVAP